MSDALFFWAGVDGQPAKLGNIEESTATISFFEAKILHDENQVIVYGYGKTDEALIKENDKWGKKTFEEKGEFIQISLPLKDFKEGKRDKKATPFTKTIGEYLKANFADKTFCFDLALNSCPAKNLDSLSKNLNYKFEEVPGCYILPAIFPEGIFCIEPNLIPKDFNLNTEVKKGNYNGSRGQSEGEKLTERLSFFKTLIYPVDVDTKELGIKEISKAFNALDENEKVIIQMIMK
jgi:hypothetical protein